MTLKPILFLDVDGVLNAFQPVRPHVTRKIGGRQVKGTFVPYTIHFDNEVVDMIDALAEHFDIVWATMWNERANDLIAPALGIEPFPVMYADHTKGWDTALNRGATFSEIRRLWYAKTPLLPEYAAGQPFAWVDDDHSLADRFWLARQDDAPEHFLLLQTDADYGIQWGDVADLITWAQALAAGTLETPWTYQGALVPEVIPAYDPDPVLYFDEDITEAETEVIDWDSDEVRGFLAAMEDESA